MWKIVTSLEIQAVLSSLCEDCATDAADGRGSGRGGANFDFDLYKGSRDELRARVSLGATQARSIGNLHFTRLARNHKFPSMDSIHLSSLICVCHGVYSVVNLP